MAAGPIRREARWYLARVRMEDEQQPETD